MVMTEIRELFYLIVLYDFKALLVGTAVLRQTALSNFHTIE